MGYHWENCPSQIKTFICDLKEKIKKMIKSDFVGFYLHGSLAMGGFNPKRSDIDILVVTGKPLDIDGKRELAMLLLQYSSSPYPIEISFLTTSQLKHWQHPCPYDFHYSETWRVQYEKALLNGMNRVFTDDQQTDIDLAAHITILNSHGICIEGKPINEVFPIVPKKDYISSILADYEDCLKNIEENPIYCALNLIRVYLYLKEGHISSKQEAGIWAIKTFPLELKWIIEKVVDGYSYEKGTSIFAREELLLLKVYISNQVKHLLENL